MWLDEEKNYHGEVIPQGDFGSYGHYSKHLPEALATYNDLS
jgi:hypothetical protein